jgi:hypothetical protein
MSQQNFERRLYHACLVIAAVVFAPRTVREWSYLVIGMMVGAELARLARKRRREAKSIKEESNLAAARGPRGVGLRG